MEITAYEKAYLGKCKNYHMAGSLKREVWWKKTEKDGEVDGADCEGFENHA